MSTNAKTQAVNNGSETNDYKDYCVCSDWDGDGEIYNRDNKIVWKFQSNRLKQFSTGLFRSPVFAFRNDDSGDLSVIYRKKRWPMAEFVVVEKNLPVCTIFQRSIFFTRYDFEFGGGFNWSLYMPMFSVRGKGVSREGKEVLIRVATRKRWFIRISTGLDSPAMMAALAFITRKKLQRT